MNLINRLKLTVEYVCRKISSLLTLFSKDSHLEDKELIQAKEKAVGIFGGVGNPSNQDLVVVGQPRENKVDLLEYFQAVTPAGFPLPGLLLFGLETLLDLERYGPHEKLQWGVRFDYKGNTFGFEYRKLGLRFLCEKHNLNQSILKEVVGKAKHLTSIAENYFKSGYADRQITEGNFTMSNLYSQLDERYRYLREQAEQAYSTQPPPPEYEETELSSTYQSFEHIPQQRGGALGSAAVDAYFSRQEHLFCIALAFSVQALPEGGIASFLAANWPSKAKTVLNLKDTKDTRVQNFYSKIVSIRNEWRNPLAHGGFLSNGESLYFHVPNVGALPFRLRKTPKGVQHDFVLPNKTFEEVMNLFDSFDDFLKNGSLQYAVKWAESGLDVSFDSESRAIYQEAIKSEQDFSKFLEWKIYDWEHHINMDY